MSDNMRCYSMQMNELSNRLCTFVRGKAKSFTTSHDLTGMWPENSKEPQTYTRTQVIEACKTFIITAQDEGPKYANALPTAPSNAGIVNALSERTTVKGESRPLVFQALAGVRRKHNKQIADNEKAAIIKATGAWYHPAAFNTDKNDNFTEFREYEAADKAAKAGCRAIHGGDWWQTDKAARLATALELVSQTMPKPMRTTKQALKMLSSMKHAKVIAIVKKAGAPKKVYSGKGALDRCLLWASENGAVVAQYV